MHVGLVAVLEDHHGRKQPELDQGLLLGVDGDLGSPILVDDRRRCGQHFGLGDGSSSSFRGNLHRWEVAELDQLGVDGSSSFHGNLHRWEVAELDQLGVDGSSILLGDLHGWEVSKLDQGAHMSLDSNEWSSCKKGLLVKTTPHRRTACIMLCWLENSEDESNDHCAVEMGGELSPTGRSSLF